MLSLISMTLGWVGMIILVIGFYFISNGSWSPRSIIYQAIQCVGCFFVALDSITKGAYPAAGLQLVVILIALKTINDVVSKKAEEIEKKIGK